MTKTHTFRHLDLFSGIGGFALAASWVWGKKHEVVSFCEIEEFPQKVLRKHWPDVPIHNDVKTMKGNQYGRIDLVSGGFPCQPYSEAGKRLGKEDDRALWPEMLRVIEEARPAWVVGENVDNFRNMDLTKSLSDLAAIGYESIPMGIPACAVGANHARERVWIIAYSNGKRPQASRGKRTPRSEEMAKWGKCQEHIYTAAFATVGHGRQTAATQSGIPRVNDGIPDRIHRNRALGNAIVPQVVVPIFECIKLIDEQCQKVH